MTIKPTKDATSPMANTRDADRRRHRRHQTAFPAIAQPIESQAVIGEIIDLSSGGARLVTTDASAKPGDVTEVRLTLPPHAGIQPFIRLASDEVQPTCAWQGKFEIARRIDRGDGTFELGGKFCDMTPVDRGMLGLYLSTQPLAA
ncbi:MAG: PilZ domain-containing protein [Planctomycetota bacterium]